MNSLPLQAVSTGGAALVVALFFYVRVKAQPEGNAEMARIARYIREGAMAFLVREYKVLAVYAVVVGGLMAWQLGPMAAAAFLAGAFLSLLAGFFGMKAATFANVRTAEAARASGKPAALVIALDGGAVMGLCVAGLGLIGMGGLYGAFGISSVDNFIRPMLISRGADLPLLLTLLGALGGVFAFGFLGLFLGPVLLALGYTLVAEWSGEAGRPLR